MSMRMTKLTPLAVMIVAATSIMVGVSTITEQDVKAQNMTINMTNSTGSEDSSSGSIAGLGTPRGGEENP